MVKYFLWMLVLLGSSKCASKMTVPASQFDIQGHRGCRGLMPENSIPAFLKAIELGVTTLEMDVVISKDHQVVVSHEPYFSHEIALDPKGMTIPEDEEQTHNLYRLTLEEIQQYDCGSIGHSRFPDQHKIKVYKPSLDEVFDRVEALWQEHELSPIRYNIEIKRRPQWDQVYHPAVEKFVALVLAVIEEHKVQDRVIIQSFDAETLQEVRRSAPKISLAWLIDNDRDLQTNIEELGFIPPIYSPNFRHVTSDLVKEVHHHGMEIIPWTVNDNIDIQRMLTLGVDGIISDYPNRVQNLVTSPGS